MNELQHEHFPVFLFLKLYPIRFSKQWFNFFVVDLVLTLLLTILTYTITYNVLQASHSTTRSMRLLNLIFIVLFHRRIEEGGDLHTSFLPLWKSAWGHGSSC